MVDYIITGRTLAYTDSKVNVITGMTLAYIDPMVSRILKKGH